MKPVLMKRSSLIGLLIVSFVLSGFVVDFHPQIVPEKEAASETAAQLNNRGVKLYAERKFSQALSNFLKASQMDTTIWQAHFNCAVALAAMGKLEEALTHLELSLNIDPDNPLTLRFYSDIQKKVNRVL